MNEHVANEELKTLPLPEVEKKLESSPNGLTQAEAEKRLIHTLQPIRNIQNK